MDSNEIVMKGKMDVIGAACGICALPEGELLERLEMLWGKGFSAGIDAGKDEIEAILKSISSELSKIVVAYMSGDQENLKSVMDDFIKRHVVVRNAGDSAKAH